MNATRLIRRIFFLILALSAWTFAPATAAAATIYLSPASGTHAVGTTFSVQVQMNTEGKAINTGEITVSYTAGTLELVRASQGSTFTLATPGSPRASGGTVYFGGGIPNPGYTGSSGTLGTLVFRVKAPGKGVVSLSDGKALLNDGFGTDAFSRATGGEYTLVSSGAPEPLPVTKGAPVISSPTHPNQSTWYATSSPVFVWTLPSGADAVSFEFDQKKDTAPDGVAEEVDGGSTQYAPVTDGVWYFHLRARSSGSFGPTAHYRIQVDTTPPEPFSLSIVTDIEGTPTVSFETTDTPSGVARYEVAVDNLVVEKSATSTMKISSISRGRHMISVLAYDYAGNLRAARTTIFVDKSVMVSLTLITLLLLLNLLITILLLILIWLEVQDRKRRAPLSQRVKRAQRDIDDRLEALRDEARNRLSTISDVPAKDIVEKEQTLEDEMTHILEDAKISIDKTIASLGPVPEKDKAKEE